MSVEDQRVTVVNAWDAGDDGAVTVAFRVDASNYWRRYHLTLDQATQLADQLRLLTRTTD